MIHVELGTRDPHHMVEGKAVKIPGPTVIMAEVPAPEALTFNPETQAADVAIALAREEHLPDNEALINMLHRDGWWAQRSAVKPDWVWADNKDFERIVSDYFGCSRGRPEDVEETYWTRSGPPGEAG